MAVVQTEVNSTAKHRSPVASFAGEAASVLGDSLKLVELQTRLAKADARLAAQRALKPTVILLVGSCAALGSLPVLTLGCSSWLSAATSLNAWQSQLLVGGVVALLAIITMYFSARSIGKSAKQFERSGREMEKNVQWLRSVVGHGQLGQPGHSDP